MKKAQSEEGKSADIVSENIERLKELFPEAFSEGGVNFDVLRQLLGDARVLDEGEEKYGLNWHGKKKARQIALTPSMGTLLPCPEESVDWDTTKNLFIEGDNLEVLKLLQKSYANKVKMIYIDPPYNTGKEFIYPDKFQENLDTYLKYTGQVDDEGIKFSSNTETTGRKHTNWLSMMYPRLKVAKTLLADDGVIFVSIDDHELVSLEFLLNEIFGEENGFVPFIWSLPRGINAGHVSRAHEYIIGYAKKKELLALFNKLGDTEYSIDRCNKKIDRRHPASPIAFPPGIRYEGEDKIFSGEIAGSEKIEIEGEMVFKCGKLAKEVTLHAGWTMKNMIVNWLHGKKVVDAKGQEIVEFFFKKNGKLYSKKKPLFESPKSILSDVPDTQIARKEIEELLGSQDIFSYPKPSGLIKRLIDLTTVDGDLVMDFFAGSCSSIQGVIDSNASENINRRFIAVQLPEKLDKSDVDQQASIEFCREEGVPENISEIAKLRIKKVIERLRESMPKSKLGNVDLGFKVFKLSNSNIKTWNPDYSDLEKSLLSHQEHLIEGRTEQDVLYELLLKRGVDLAVPIESREVRPQNTRDTQENNHKATKDLSVFSVSSVVTIYSVGYGVLFACLDDSIKKEQVEEIGQAIVEWHRELAPSSDTHVFFRDSAFSDDVSKTNMAAILEQNGITHVRSL